MKKVDPRDLIDWWLTKYHNTTLKEVEDTHPEWMEDPQKHTRDFYQTYAVTKEQHDEWETWAKEYTKKITKIKGRIFDKSWCWVYLDVAPSIKQEEL